MAVGSGITLKHWTEKKVTVKYPYEDSAIHPRWRGPVRLRGIMGRDEVPLVSSPFYEYNKTISDLFEADRLSPCTGACPANVDARGQNALVAEGRLIEAYELVRSRNIFPGVLGRICHHPCESACRRNYFDEPLAVRPLHRLIGEAYGQQREKIPARNFATRTERVAIIGSGPSGLAAAFDLIQLGYPVTIFEKNQLPGGALMTGVPKYRLPREVLLAEISDIEKMGVEIRTGVEIGKDMQLGDLMNEGYSAILLAVGLQVSRVVPIPGADAKGVELALPLLRAAAFDEPFPLGKRVLVVGGGNVAVDVARCAKRMGGEKVELVCLEAAHEVPAHPWEVEEAAEEGIPMHCSWGPEEVLLDKKGHVRGLRVKECTAVFDEQGRFSPQFCDNFHEFECDTLVFAIGQGSDLEWLKGTGVQRNKRGQLIVDGLSLTTTQHGVFASGEVVTGPGSCIGSIASGHEAAISIHAYLSGHDPTLGRVSRPVPQYYRYAPINLDRVELERRRTPMPMADPEERVKDFRPVESGFTELQGRKEATRCLRCESWVCVGCTMCARTCPDLAIRVERSDFGGRRNVHTWDYDEGKCCFCGMCAEVCPTQAVTMSNEVHLVAEGREDLLWPRDRVLREPRPEERVVVRDRQQ